MKVALLTYFQTLSYGATLQAYATVKAIESLGHEVELINLDIPNPYNKIKGILLFPKWFKIWCFRQKFFKQHITRKFFSSEDLRQDPPEADLYMIGSDQTWNLDISLDKAPSFFLDFVKDDSKKVSYAASFGKNEIGSSKWIKKEEILTLLKRFNHIGIREDSGKTILSLENIDSTLVVDPVLLFDHYDELIGEFSPREEIALFKVENSTLFYNRMREVGKDLFLPICSVGSLRRVKGIKCPYPYGVEGWMRRIVSAKYVITDSFHGLVLSLLYHKQFVIIIGDPLKATRLQSLANMVGLSDRILGLDNTSSEIVSILNNPIDYDYVDMVLNDEREKSYNFLKSILNR